MKPSLPPHILGRVSQNAVGPHVHRRRGRSRRNASVSKLPVVFSENGSFDLRALAASLPESAETMLLDMRLTDEAAASSRLFRVSSNVPAHYHETGGEYRVVIRGRAGIVVAGADPVEVAPGKMQFFRRGGVHG